MKMKKWMRMLVAMLMLALLNTALAETGAVSVRVHAGETNVPRAILEIYRIGDAKIENANRVFEINDSFSGSGETLSDLNDKALPGKLADYARANGILVLEAVETDADGIARFEGLEEGAYLICQDGFSKKSYFTEIEPFIVTVPITVDGEWTYQVEAEPKVEPIPTPTPKPTKPPEDPNLPQTGLVRWPILALGVGGVVLFGLGWALCFVKRRKNA